MNNSNINSNKMMTKSTTINSVKFSTTTQAIVGQQDKSTKVQKMTTRGSHSSLNTSSNTKYVSNVQKAHIYRVTTELMQCVIDLIPEMPKPFKYSFGDKMQNISIELVENSVYAYKVTGNSLKISSLEKLQTNLEIIELLIRTAYERQWIKGIGKWAYIFKLIESAKLQSEAWKNSLDKQAE